MTGDTTDRDERVADIYAAGGYDVADPFPERTHRIIEWLASWDHDVFYGVLSLVASVYCNGLAEGAERATVSAPDDSEGADHDLTAENVTTIDPDLLLRSDVAEWAGELREALALLTRATDELATIMHERGGPGDYEVALGAVVGMSRLRTVLKDMDAQKGADAA